MKTLKISDIRTDGGTQIRVRLDDATVNEYAEAFADGAKFPPVIVFNDGSQNLLADGFHRVMAAIRAGIKDILADVRQGGRSECLKYALSANASHGLKRTNADKRRSVELALSEWPKLSNVELSRICCVSDEMVRQVRTVAQPPIIGGSQTRIGGDGKERKLPTPKAPIAPPQPPAVQTPVPPPPTQAPMAPPPSLKAPAVKLDCTGYPVPENLIELWDTAEDIQSAALTPLSALRGLVRNAQEHKNPAFVEINFSSVLAHLDQAYADFKTVKPYAVCPTCQGLQPDQCTLCSGRGFVSEHRWTACVPRETKELRFKLKKS